MSRRRWLLAAAAVVTLWLAACVLLLVRAGGELQAGRREITLASARLDARAVTDPAVRARFASAAEHFRHARRDTRHPLLAPLRFVPVVGRQVRSADALAGVATTVGDAAADALGDVRAALDRGVPSGRDRVAQVQRLAEAAATAHRRVRRVLDDLGPRIGLLGPLAEARNELGDRLVDADSMLADAATGTAAVAKLLEGPRRYLLVAANNAEMRAGSGMWLSGGVLEIEDGSLRLGEVAPLYELADPPGPVPVADADLERVWGFTEPSLDWRRLMPSPRLPASAALARDMWEAAGHEAVDGVLVLDPVAVSHVVAATGPLEVDGTRYESASIPRALLLDQYLDRPAADDRDERREVLGRLTAVAFEAVNAGRFEVTRLVEELADAVRGRHLLAWAADADEQAGWRAAGMDGALEPDSLFLSVLNRAGNKMDWFLHVDAELEASRAAGGTDVAVEVTLENRGPGDGLPRYVAGPPSGLDYEPGTYRGILTLDVPGDAGRVRVDGGEAVVAGPDGPARVVGVVADVPPGRSSTWTFRFRVPAGRRRLVVEPSARVPFVSWRYGSRTWEDFAPVGANLRDS